MPDLTDIREGLAANLDVLRAAGHVGQVSPFLLDNPTPPALMVAGVSELEFLTFGSVGNPPGVRWQFLIEACVGKTSDVGSQKILNALLAPTGSSSLVAAVEADAALTSRLNEEGTLRTGQEPAAESVSFTEYRGQTPFVLENGIRVLLATWAFEVLS